MTVRLCFFVLLCFSFRLSCATEPDSVSTVGDRWSLEMSGNVSRLVNNDGVVDEILHSRNTRHFDVRLTYRPFPKNKSPYDAGLNAPALQVGFLCGDYDRLDIWREKTPYHSKVGYMLTPFVGVQLEFLRWRRWAFGADLQNGVGICLHPYNEHNNADNDFIGSALSIYVGGGFYAKYRLSSRWSMSLGLDFKHYSNGTLDRPNNGLNSLGPTVALHYDLKPQPLREEIHRKDYPLEKVDYRKGFYVDLTAGLGMKALIDRFALHRCKHNPVYGFFTTMVAPMYRYSLLHASGIGIDYSYADYVFKIREYDHERNQTQYSYSPHILGASLRHEVFYHHFSVNVGLGVYLLKKTGMTASKLESPIYQTISLRYSLPFTNDRLHFGYNVKAHRFSKVDCVQLILGYRIGGK